MNELQSRMILLDRNSRGPFEWRQEDGLKLLGASLTTSDCTDVGIYMGRIGSWLNADMYSLLLNRLNWDEWLACYNLENCRTNSGLMD